MSTNKQKNDNLSLKALRPLVIEAEELLRCQVVVCELAYALSGWLDAVPALVELTLPVTFELEIIGQSEVNLDLKIELASEPNWSKTAIQAQQYAENIRKNCTFRLTKRQYEQILQYYYLRTLFNLRINLSRLLDSAQIVNADIQDCFYLLEALNCKEDIASKVLDIGTGSGIPGLLLAILRPNMQITLLDTVQKKLAFIELALRELELNNCQLAWARVEDFAHTKARQSFDYVLSRAVSPLATLLEYSLPLTKVDGYSLCFKTSLEATTDANKLFNVLGAVQCASYVYPEELNSDLQHLILKFQQKQVIKQEFPRNLNLPRTKSLDIIQKL